jgi:N-methylhydantoinase B/oxoprolinase/acetone carboxylase alpha subunit
VKHEKPGKASFNLFADEVVMLETPGGGGWGAPVRETAE